MARLKDADTLRAIIAHQNGVAKRQFFDKKGNRLWVGARDFAALEARVVRDGGGSIDRVPGYNKADAVLFHDCDGEPEVWVDPHFQNYRGAFGAILRLYYDYSLADAELRGLDVDHVYSRSAALGNKLRYVRLAGVDKGANRARGAHEERLGAPLNAIGLAAATVADYCKIHHSYLLLGDKGIEEAGVPMMIAGGVMEGFIPKSQATVLITRGQSEVKAAFK
jgi:hypothetical protein